MLNKFSKIVYYLINSINCFNTNSQKNRFLSKCFRKLCSFNLSIRSRTIYYFVLEPWMLQDLIYIQAFVIVFAKKLLGQIHHIWRALLPRFLLERGLLELCFLLNLFVIANKWHTPRHQIVQKYSQTPRINFLIVIAISVHDFWSHIQW